MARLCEDYGVPVTCTTDGRPQYKAGVVKKSMGDYGIYHRCIQLQIRMQIHMRNWR